MSNKLDREFSFRAVTPPSRIFACHRNPGPFNVRSKVGGVWGDELVPPADHAPHAIDVAPDGTLWLAMNYFFGQNEVWRKLPGGSWTELAQRSVSFNCISAVSQTECWFTDGHILVDRYIHGVGFTTWNLEATLSFPVVEFRQTLIHAYGSNEVVAVGIDGSSKIWFTRWNGSSWSDTEAGFTHSHGNLLGAFVADGDNMYFALGSSGNGTHNRLYKHTNRGIGGGWTEIGASGTGWPTNIRVPNGIWVNPNDPNEIWVCWGRPSANGSDLARTTDGGANWTAYTVGNSTYGCASMYGDNEGKVYIGHNQDDLVAVWNGASFDANESSGSGGFTGYIWGPGQDQGYQRLLVVPDLLPSIGEAEKDQPQKSVKVIVRDDFESTSLVVDTEEPYGSVSAANGLNITLGAAESGDQFFNSTFAVPHASFNIGNRYEDVLEFEAGISAFTGSDANRLYGMALLDTKQAEKSYYQFFYREDFDRFDFERGLNGAGHTTLATSPGVGPFNNQHRVMMQWNRVDNTITLFYSTNDGATWTRWYQRDIDFTPDQVVLYVRQFSSNPSIDVTFDYLEIRAGSTVPKSSSPGPGTVSAAEERFSLPAGAAGEPTYHGTGNPGGYLHEKVSAVVDGYAFPAGAGGGYHGQPDSPAGSLFENRAGSEDSVFYQLDVPVDFADFKQDGDSNDLLGGVGIVHVQKVDTSLGSFGNPIPNNHYGAARDGIFYEDGVACGPGDFGTLVGGFRRTAWRRGQDEPMALYQDMGAQATLTADDTINLDTNGAVSGWSEHGPQVVSNGKWVLTGDFDIEVQYGNWTVSGNEAFLGMTVSVQDIFGGASQINFRMARARFGGTDQYYKDALNPAASGAASVGTADTSGRMRITRTGTTLRAYYWTGAWTQLGTDDTTATAGSGPVYVRIYLSAQSSTDVSVDIHSFVINSGATSNLAGWAREASGAHRGTQATMPTNLGIVATASSVDLLDLTTNKLWMRFVNATNNAIFATNGATSRKLYWDNGALLVAHGTAPPSAQDGAGILIDFTLDFVRIYRETGSIPGAIYGGSKNKAVGGIATRNDGLTYGNAVDTAYQIPDYRVYGAGLYRAGGFEYHAWGTYEGAHVSKWQYGYLENSPRVDWAKSTEVVIILAILFDPSSGELFYMDSTNLYSVSKTNWEGPMSTTQLFSADTTKALPGTRTTNEQHQMVRFGANVMVAAQEGIYDVAWPAGSFTLLYGDADSTATHKILPKNQGVRAIALAKDGATNLLVCGLESEITSVAVINLDSNTLYGIIPRGVMGKTPITVAG